MIKKLADKKTIIVIILFIITVIFQGGFFQGTILSIVLIETILCFALKARFDKVSIFMMLFCIWHIFCAVRGGFIIEFAAQAIMPVAVMLFYMIICTLSREQKQKIVKASVHISVYIALVAIVMCVSNILMGRGDKRLLFPFQYSNASGIYFAIMIILSKKQNMKKYEQVILYIALFMTQSVGAVGLMAAAEIVYSKSLKKTVLIILALVVGGVLFYSRVYESVGTFIERLLQMYDGLKCISQNPLMGIGVGRWAEYGQKYKSGFYTANVIHSCPIQICVDSGIIGIVLLLICVAAVIKKSNGIDKNSILCVIMFFVHSMFDFSMSFAALNMLLMLVLTSNIDNTEFEPTLFNSLPLAAIMIVVIFGMFCEIYSIGLEQQFIRKNYKEVERRYEAIDFTNYSDEMPLIYAKALYNDGKYNEVDKFLDNVRYKTTDMIILQSWCGDYSVLVDALSEMRYNQKLYDEIDYVEDEYIKAEANSLYDEAVNELSYLGEILYNMNK